MIAFKLALGTVATAGLAVATLAGCQNNQSGSASGASPSAAASNSAASPASTAAAAGSAPATQAAPSGGNACTTSDLSLDTAQGPQASGTSGDFYIELVNKSASTCTLYGFPGVDFKDSSGTSLGMKDNWQASLSSTSSKAVQTLAPGSAAAADVEYTSAKPGAAQAGYGEASEVSVIPPNQTTALTAKIMNLYTGAITIQPGSQTLTVGPMDSSGAMPHK